MLLTVASIGLTLAMLGLAITCISYAAKNMTKIDEIKGKFKLRDRKKEYPNPYDLGIISNFATIFEGEIWTWWWPSAKIPKADGMRFPMIPPVRTQDKATLPINIR